MATLVTAEFHRPHRLGAQSWELPGVCIIALLQRSLWHCLPRVSRTPPGATASAQVALSVLEADSVHATFNVPRSRQLLPALRTGTVSHILPVTLTLFLCPLRNHHGHPGAYTSAAFNTQMLHTPPSLPRKDPPLVAGAITPVARTATQGAPHRHCCQFSICLGH